VSRIGFAFIVGAGLLGWGLADSGNSKLIIAGVLALLLGAWALVVQWMARRRQS
jgi:hypothetical protein